MEFTGLTPGSEAVYICQEGYYNDGPVMRVCLNDTSWSENMSQCLMKSVFNIDSFSLKVYIMLLTWCLS